MSEEPREEETIAVPVEAKPVVARKCEHKGTLEKVSASVAEVPSAVEKNYTIEKCKVCKELVFTKK